MVEKSPYSFMKLFLAYTFCMIPFGLFGGVLALLNIDAVKFNGLYKYGFEGMVVSIALAAFAVLVFSMLNWLALNFGNFLHLKFTQLIKRKST